MPTWDISDIRSALVTKGFRYARANDHDHLRLCLQDGTITSVKTKLSKGKREDIAHSSPLFASFKRELSLSTAELGRLFSCPMTGEEYIEVLIQKGVLKLGN